ncbi:MAG TPA: type II toxin-antitoxin system prevent-host-death family antitoxin [Mycobacterium sp.]
MCHLGAVEQIGIRELRQHASRWVAKAKAGAAILITDRGRPVARLVPITAAEHARETLIAKGLLQPAPRPRPKFGVEQLIDGPPLTEILDDMRSDR